MKRIFFLLVNTITCTVAFGQNVGIGVPTPNEQLHVDSAIRIGKNQVLVAPRKNLLKFGDESFVSIGEETADDKLYIRFGDLIFLRGENAAGLGRIGINVEQPTTDFDLLGGLRLRSGLPGLGKVLTSDALGNASWQTFSGAGWSLTGNAGTNAANNFLGTTDNQPLMFRLNNIYSGKWDYSQRNYFIGNQSGKNSTGRNNVAIGDSALLDNTTGYSNIAIGSGALQNSTTKYGLVAIGDSALFLNSTFPYYNDPQDASENTAVGSKALYRNTAGSRNTALGFEAGKNMALGRFNTAIGAKAMNVSGSSEAENCVAIGYYALDSTSRGFNTAVGSQSMRRNGSGERNVAVGYRAMFNNKTGRHNTAIGEKALEGNEAGFYNTAVGQGALGGDGNSNVAVGTAALARNTSRSNLVAVGDSALFSNSQGATDASQGAGNTALGSKVLWNNTTGSSNTGVGANAMAQKTDGTRNTAIGFSSGQGGLTGNYCTFLGAVSGTDNGSATYNNSTAIGDGVRVTASNQVRVGDAGVTSIGGQVGWTTLSDGRYKKDLLPNVPGLAFINQLQPLTYRLRTADLQQKTGTAEKDYSQASSMVLSGFVAQDVEAAAIRVGYSFSGVDKPVSPTGFYGLRYADFVVPLVRATQELSQANEQLQHTLNEQQQTIQLLERRLAALEKLLK